MTMSIEQMIEASRSHMRKLQQEESSYLKDLQKSEEKIRLERQALEREQTGVKDTSGKR